MKKSSKIALVASIVIVAAACASILLLQRSDAATINAARKVNEEVLQYCESLNKVPSRTALLVRFPNLTRKTGWIFFSDGKTYMTMQYPVKWWNGDAIGVAKLSEFTATPYAYVVEYKCRPPK